MEHLPEDPIRRLTNDPPDWLRATPGRGLGVEWLDQAEWVPLVVEDYPARTMIFEHLVDADREIRTGKVLVARGPSITRRIAAFEVLVCWYVDPTAPDRLWCALGESYPGWLWFAVEPTEQAMTEALGGMFPKPGLGEAELIRKERGFAGYRSEVVLPNVYSGELVPFNGHDLDRYFTGVPFVEYNSWGSARTEDPLLDDIPATSPIAVLAASREGRHAQQLLGRVPSMSWRTVHSRSYLSFEIHTVELICVRLAYRPSPPSHRAVVRRCNEELGFNLPADVPLDVVGALTGFGFNGEQDIIENVTKPDNLGQLADGLRICAALWEGDLASTLRLREFARHPERNIRLAIVRIAHSYNLPFLLYDVALASEDDPELSAAVEDVIERGCTPEDLNVFEDHFDGMPMFVDEEGNEHEGTWPGMPADDETNDDEDEE